MATLTVLSHIPGIKTESEHYAFGEGNLVRLPHAQWNALTGGAYEKSKEAYSKTAPVFYCQNVECEADWIIRNSSNNTGFFEVKLTGNNVENTNIHPIVHFALSIIENISSLVVNCLNLASPASPIIPPHWSQIFIFSDEHCFVINDKLMKVIRLQGDADHEALLIPGDNCSTITDIEVANAQKLWKITQTSKQNDALANAIDQLFECGRPSLQDIDQLLLSTVAIEVLILQNCRSQLRQTFAKRLGVLLSVDSDKEWIEKIAKQLYDARSSAIHGQKQRAKYIQLQSKAVGQRLLAASITALGDALVNHKNIDDIIDKLDEGIRPISSGLTLPINSQLENDFRPQRRIQSNTYSSVGFSATSHVDMSAPSGQVFSWSPILGLGCDESLPIKNGKFMIYPLSNVELVALEEKDISRDFINKLRVNELIEHPEQSQSCCIALIDFGKHDLAKFEKQRELAVATLRLCGFHKFIDPEYAGWFIYEERIRFRIPTIVRQSFYMEAAKSKVQTITAKDLDKLEQTASLIGSCKSSDQGELVDEILGEYLRAHPNRFFKDVTSASLLLALLERILGRFGHQHDKPSLENRIVFVLNENLAAWFTEHGRAFRNDVAHGRFDKQMHASALDTLIEITSQVILSWLRYVKDNDSKNKTIEDFRHSLLPEN